MRAIDDTNEFMARHRGVGPSMVIFSASSFRAVAREIGWSDTRIEAFLVRVSELEEGDSFQLSEIEG